MVARWMDGANQAEDLRYGQRVIIAARWILIATGLVLVLWSPAPLMDLRIQLALVVGLAVANFWLTAQVLMRSPVLTEVVYALSAADIAVISMIIATQDGFASNNYVFLFPAVLAMSVAFQPSMVVLFTGAAVGAYGLMVLTTSGEVLSAEVVLIRVAMLAAVAVCGTVFRRVERENRRRVVVESRVDHSTTVKPVGTRALG